MMVHITEAGGTLNKVAAIVETLALHGDMGPAEIAEETGIPRSTVYRLLEGLQDVDLVSTMSDRNAVLSLRWARLADAARDSLVEWSSLAERLTLITDETGLTSFLTVVRGDETVCIEWAQGEGIDALVLKPGRVLPLHAGAAGRAALAQLGDQALEGYLRKAPFPAFNEHTLTTEEQLRADVALNRARGYALSEEDVTPGIGAVGVPVHLEGRQGTIGCLSVGGYIGEIRAEHEELAAVLTRAVADFSR